MLIYMSAWNMFRCYKIHLTYVCINMQEFLNRPILQKKVRMILWQQINMLHSDIDYHCLTTINEISKFKSILKLV